MSFNITCEMEEHEHVRNGITIISPNDSTVEVSDDMNIKPFADKSCNPETSYTFIKNDPYENAKCAPNQQRSMIEYLGFEGCLDIKSEEPDIKTEEDECDRNIYNSLSLIHSVEVSPEDTDVDKSYNPEINQTNENDPYQDACETEMEYSKGDQLNEDETVTCYRCKHCSYMTKQEGELSKHVLIHPKPVEIRTYDCSLCPYKAKRTGHLTRHMLVHKDASEIRTYDCCFCSYKARYKRNLTTHLLIHQDDSEATTYDCSFCSYKTKLKYNLTAHMLIHQDGSEVTIYQCSLCPYNTKRKGDLPKHMKIHKDVSEVTTYDCVFCSYKAKEKSNLNRHMLIHQDDSEVTTYQCAICPYNTKWKADLPKHMKIHKDLSEMTTYDCVFCSYKAKRKSNLNKHMLVHREGSEAITYQCTLCPYKTRHKNYLTSHKLIHQDVTGVQENMEDAEFEQNRQESTMEYNEPQDCLDIKAEELDIKKEEDECDGDAEVKPCVDASYNPDTNHTTIKSDSCQDAPEQEMDYPEGHKVTEDVEVDVEELINANFIPTRRNLKNI